MMSYTTNLTTNREGLGDGGLILIASLMILALVDKRRAAKARPTIPGEAPAVSLAAKPPE